MAKVLFAVYLIVLSIGSAAAYAEQCAVGPEYWCKSLENAQDCGALQHCTDTVWSLDAKFVAVDSSATCEWCERVLGNTDQSLGENEDMIVSKFIYKCNLLPSADLTSKCTNIIKNYKTSIVSLMQKKRFTTLCRLMDICTEEKEPVVLGSKRCTWGPSYWCSSLSNSRECGSIDHCSNQIWSRQAIQKKENDNICQYCEYIIDKLRSVIEENKTTINANKWLTGACSMLQSKTAIDECVQTMSQYGEEILVLVKNHIDSGVICHLGQMCKDATIIPREKANEEESKMLCHAIVRATHELHVNQKKNQDEIQSFLKNDCQQLSTFDLREKCQDLVEQYGNHIYGHVVGNMELSKICDETAFQPLSHVHCDLCTFVIAMTKTMLNAKHPEDEVLGYIDEQLCSRLDGDMAENCQYTISTNREDLIDQIQQGKQSMLICTYFQVCFYELIDQSSPIKKDEMHSFVKENICDHLGVFENSCNALMEKDTTGLLKSLINDVNGDVLCQTFGICPRQMSLIDNLSINDDKNKCKRCLDDFTRRKHIAEKLLNHSSEFLHHLCGQLPNKDECTKSVDESINKLVQFIQSLNPQEICVELKACNQTSLENIQTTSLNNAISDEAMTYIKAEICAKIGPLSKWCIHLMDSEGTGLFNLISKYTDPHQVCSVIDVCPTTKAFENCNDKCECCVSKVENYQVQLATFLHTLLATAEDLCHSMPYSEDCLDTAGDLKSIIDEILSDFNARRICEVSNHCSSSISAECNINSDNHCECCKDNLNIRQTNFREIIDETRTNLLSFCINYECRSTIQSNYDEIINKIHRMDYLTLCQRIGFCSIEDYQQLVPFLSDLSVSTHLDLSSNIEELSENICANFGDVKPICEHLIGSTTNKHYRNIYMALLKNNPSLIDENLRSLNTDTCDGCKNAVQSGKDFSINALESIRNVLLQTCEYCTSKDQCRNFYNQKFDNLTTYINQIHPEQFCQNIHLCSVALTDACGTCIQRFDQRKDGVSQAIDRLAGYFDDLCQKYGDKQCQIYVKQVKDSITTSIEDFNSKDACNSIGFCSTINEEMNFDDYEKYIESRIETNICSTLGPFEVLCKDVIHGNTEHIQSLKMKYDIEDLMKIGEEFIEISNGTDKCHRCIARVIQRKKHIKFVGNQFFNTEIRSCNYCPAKHQCRQYWKAAKARFNERIHKICPYQVCEHLGFCNKTIESPKTELKPIDESNSTCILCEYLMKILSNYISQQSTEEEIEDNLQKICNQIPSVLQNQCREYIDDYSPTIISILLNEFDLSTVCHKLNLCTNQMKFDINHLIQADTATCGVCDYVSTYVYFNRQHNSYERSLATVCTHLYGEQNLKCQIILQLFSPHIQQLELGPGNNFCKQLTICQTPMIDLKPGISIDKEPKATPKCTICQYIISYLDATLKNNKSEQAVEAALEKVCTILPEKARSECEQLVKTYGHTIAELIADSADPNTICQYLGVCQKSTNMIVQTPYTCNICQYIVSRMKYFTGLNQNENEVLVSLKEACDLFSLDNLKKQCKDFLAQQGSYFSPIISDETQPKIACQGIGICQHHYKQSTTTIAPVSPVTKYGRCIFGMHYWCTSRENAELCNAVELCEREVWSKRNIVITLN